MPFYIESTDFLNGRLVMFLLDALCGKQKTNKRTFVKHPCFSVETP